MVTIKTTNKQLSLFKSEVKCPFCKIKIPLKYFEKIFDKQDKSFIKYRCKCRYYFGIT